jgi:ribosomal peptide maturation radical SAM protein 1
MGKSMYSKTKRHNRIQFKIVLVSAPWALFHRPSIQLASLRSYLQEKGGYSVNNRHLYLNIAKKIGIELYSRIATSGWAGEALFAPLLFPQKREEAARLFSSELKGDGKGVVPNFDSLVADIEECCDTWLSGIDLEKISLLGFSVCFSQLLPSLYLASQFKTKADISTVFGGSSCSESVGLSLIKHFDQIDYLIDGEGEMPLLELCNYLSGLQTNIPTQVKARQIQETNTKTSGIKQLDELPIPDFDPYLKEIRQLFVDLPFIPTLPIEFSRGCRWNHCTFCNLNLQWKGYRHKSAKRIIAEVQELSVRNESLNFAFTDNMLPEKETENFFQAMADSKHDFNFFGEIRAKTSPDKLFLFRRGGLQSVQVGIESLSTSLLSRMRKGTTTMDNLAIMKYCCANRILLLGNIITEFPGTSREEIEETLSNLDFVLPYLPLEAASFFLGYDSPIYRQPRDYGISAIMIHPKNRMLFPQQYQGEMLISGYRGDKKNQQKQWRPVRERIRAWQDFHRNRNSNCKPALYYRDGGGYLIIHQELPEKPALLHRLRGVSREIYLFCDQPKRIEEIGTSFPRLSRESIEKFIRQLSSKRLMFHEADRILSLAVRVT